MTDVAPVPSRVLPSPSPSVRLPAIDDGFPRRVLRTSVVLAALGVVFACVAQAWTIAIGFGLGAVLGCLAFVTLAWTVSLFMGGGPAPGWGRAAVLGVALVKLPLFLVALWFIVARLHGDVFALVAGLVLTQAVMVLKVAGMLVTQRHARFNAQRPTSNFQP